MPVYLYGLEDAPEYEWANKFKKKFEEDSNLINNPNNKIHIVPSVQCYGYQPQELDIVILGELENYKTEAITTFRGSKGEAPQLREVKIDRFCAVIEVKRHSPEKIEFQGNQVYVTYTKGEKRNATEQNFNQKFSLKNYLGQRWSKTPWVSHLIYLPYCPKNAFEEIPESNILFTDFNLADLGRIILTQSPDKLIKLHRGELTYSAWPSGMDYENDLKGYVEILTKKIKASKLDMKKVTQICKKIVKEQQYGEKLGTQLLIFRGRGGTGKTFRLLNLAHELYTNELARVLILTYNHALISDVRRLFAIMRIKDGIDESIQIRSLYQFWYTLFSATGIRTKKDIETEDSEFSGAIPKKLKNELKSYIKDFPNEIELLRFRKPDLLSWDYVMVDEAQDWPNDERDLLYQLFSPDKIVIADGYDQLIRRTESCNWRGSPLVKNKQILNLSKSMRQKSEIVKFLQEMAKKLNIDELNIRPSEKLYGGKIIVLNGRYTESFHKKLITTNQKAKNENVDMLFCVPPKLIDNKSRKSSISMDFDKWGFKVWDGVDMETRKKTFPTELDQLRIVQYDSCRGLEGWICVNFSFDEFYKYKLGAYKDLRGQTDFRSVDEKKQEFAANWLLVPLTRAIDTLVLQIDDPDSHVGKILKEIHEENPDYDIEWINECYGVSYEDDDKECIKCGEASECKEITL